LEIKEECVKPYKPSEDKKCAARDDKFLEKVLLNSINSSEKIVDDERYRPEWMKAINEENIVEMVNLIITCHTSMGKASESTDKFIAVEEHRNFSYKEGKTIAEYDNQLYLGRLISQLEIKFLWSP
jgi:hypothetical protein